MTKLLIQVGNKISDLLRCFITCSFWAVGEKNFQNKEKMQNMLQNHSSLFPTSYKIIVSPIIFQSNGP